MILTFIELPYVIKIFVLSIFEWPFCKGFTVQILTTHMLIRWHHVILVIRENGDVL